MIEEIQIKDDNSKFKKLLSDCYVDPSEDLEKPPVALQIGLTEFKGRSYKVDAFTYGNFSVIEGKSKARKTFLMSLLVGCYYGGRSSRLASNIIGYRNGKKIIHFDTEQGKFHAQRVFRRVVKIYDEPSEDYITFALRSLSSKDRAEFIEYVLYESEYKDDIGLVIIDGIADLMTSYNDEEQATKAVQNLMKWSEEKNCHISTIVHLNKYSPDAKGHLGSFLYQKAETVINLSKDEENDENVIVHCKHSRGFSFDDFKFIINENSLPEVNEEEDVFMTESDDVMPF